jgi:steroid delta-isomerase-like uncharacterized protein
MNDDTRRVATEFFDAFGRRDVDALMQIVSDDIVEDLPGVGIVSGLDEERAFLTGLFGSFPDLTTEVTRITIDGRVAAIEWKRRGTFTGAPWQGLPASGRAFESTGATFVEVVDGRVTKVTVYSDSAQVARGIGVLPAEGSATERLARALYGLQVRLGRAGHRLAGRGRRS